LKENSDYLDNQRVVNKNLVDMLKKDEGKEVVLQENSGNIYKAGDADLNSTLEEKVSLERFSGFGDAIVRQVPFTYSPLRSWVQFPLQTHDTCVKSVSQP
jgi:hypothetical protein